MLIPRTWFIHRLLRETQRNAPCDQQPGAAQDLAPRVEVKAMSKDMSELVGLALGKAARDAVHAVSATMERRSRGTLSGSRGLLVGAGLAVVAPVATKGMTRIIRE